MESLASKRALFVTLPLDLAISLGTYLLAFRVRFLFTSLPLFNWVPFLHALPFLVLLALITHALFGVYQPQLNIEEAQATVLTSSFGNLIAAMALSYFVGSTAIPRSVLLIAAVLQALALVVSRRWMTGTFQTFRPLTTDVFTMDPELLMATLAEDEVHVDPNPVAVLLTGARVVRTDEFGFRLAMPMVGLSPGERAAKRALDLVLGLLLFLPAVALGLVISAAVAIGSGFPVFYSQHRVGRLGRIFRVIKFRTMANGAEDESGPALTSLEDERLTRVGRTLRSSRLDELPQLLNILRGEMSFVGPRPERPEFVEEFLERIPFYSLRLRVKPGLTGIAQLYGTYGLPVEEKLKYDVYYLVHHSLALDILLILRSLSVPFQPRKASGVPGSHDHEPRADLAHGSVESRTKGA